MLRITIISVTLSVTTDSRANRKTRAQLEDFGSDPGEGPGLPPSHRLACPSKKWPISTFLASLLSTTGSATAPSVLGGCIERKQNITTVTRLLLYSLIGHFWVGLCLCFKPSPSAKPFNWKRPLGLVLNQGQKATRKWPIVARSAEPYLKSKWTVTWWIYPYQSIRKRTLKNKHKKSAKAQN